MRPVPAVEPRLLALLGRVWPSIPPAVARADALGFSWASVSTPFVRYAGARAVAHVGVIELPLVIDGRQRMVGSIHGVCTDVDRGGCGHARALMDAALAHCRARYGTVLLTTLIPRFYARHHGFHDDCRSARWMPARSTPRPCSCSRCCSAGGDFSRAYYHAGLDVMTVHEVVGRTLVLYDAVGAAIPPLAELLEAIGAQIDRVVTCFVPERFGAGFCAEAWDRARAQALGDGSFAGLMARGAPMTGSEPLMLPVTVRT